MESHIFGASCRRGGNTDYAVSLIQKTWDNVIYNRISEENIVGCIGCGYCDTYPGTCAFDKNSYDKAAFYFKTMFDAERIVFISPIYFYHVPSQLKAFLDRAQAWYNVPEEKKMGNGRSCGLILLGAREQGDKLFEGAILSFQYALKSLGFKLHDPLLLYGMDEKTDLAKSLTACRQVIDYARLLSGQTS